MKIDPCPAFGNRYKYQTSEKQEKKIGRFLLLLLVLLMLPQAFGPITFACFFFSLTLHVFSSCLFAYLVRIILVYQVFKSTQTNFLC